MSKQVEDLIKKRSKQVKADIKFIQTLFHRVLKKEHAQDNPTFIQNKNP